MTKHVLKQALADRIRAAITEVRRKSYPLADLIPMMQEAADALEQQPVQERNPYKNADEGVYGPEYMGQSAAPAQQEPIYRGMRLITLEDQNPAVVHIAGFDKHIVKHEDGSLGEYTTAQIRSLFAPAAQTTPDKAQAIEKFKALMANCTPDELTEARKVFSEILGLAQQGEQLEFGKCDPKYLRADGHPMEVEEAAPAAQQSDPLKTFIASQEPLPADMQRVLHDNLDALYEGVAPAAQPVNWAELVRWWESGNEDFQTLKQIVSKMLAAAPAKE